MQDPLLSKRLAGVVRDFGQTVMIWQLAVLAGTLALAWLLARWLRARIEARRRAAGRAPGTGASSLDRALFPLAGGLLLLVAQEVGERFFSTSLLQLALVLLFGTKILYLTMVCSTLGGNKAGCC